MIELTWQNGEKETGWKAWIVFFAFAPVLLLVAVVLTIAGFINYLKARFSNG